MALNEECFLLCLLKKHQKATDVIQQKGRNRLLKRLKNRIFFTTFITGKKHHRLYSCI